MIELISEPTKHTFAKPTFERIYVILETSIYKDKY